MGFSWYESKHSVNCEHRWTLDRYSKPYSNGTMWIWQEKRKSTFFYRLPNSFSTDKILTYAHYRRFGVLTIDSYHCEYVRKLKWIVCIREEMREPVYASEQNSNNATTYIEWLFLAYYSLMNALFFSICVCDVRRFSSKSLLFFSFWLQTVRSTRAHWVLFVISPATILVPSSILLYLN